MKRFIFLGFGVERNVKGKILGFTKTFHCHLFQRRVSESVRLTHALMLSHGKEMSLLSEN